MEVDENIGDPSNIAVKLVVTNEDDRSQSQINHSIIEFEEEDVSTDKHQIPQLPANTRSRSMLSLARTKMMSLVNVKSNVIQDHFVINMCSTALSLLPSVEVTDIWPLFVSEEKCKEIVKSQQRTYPHTYSLKDAWQALEVKTRKDDLKKMRTLHRVVDEYEMMGITDRELRVSE